MRLYLNRHVVETFTEDELKTSAAQAGLDGSLLDYAAKGTRVEVACTEKVEGQDTDKTKMDYEERPGAHVWINAQSFLEAKIRGQPRRMDGPDIRWKSTSGTTGRWRSGDSIYLVTRVLPVGKTTTGFRDGPVLPERIIWKK